MSQSGYFKLGLFILTAIVLMAGTVVSLGAGLFRQPGVIVETYLDESVQGLEIGSPVKYRGVKVGDVREITFVGGEYPEAPAEAKRYVLIRSELANSFVGSEADLKTQLEEQVRQGLRVRLASQGITGVSYIEVDYPDIDEEDEIDVTWEPKHINVPSAPSLINVVTESLQNVARQLEDSKINEVADNIDELIDTVDETVESLQLNNFVNEATTLVSEARQTNDEIRKLLQSEELETIQRNAAEASETARRTIATLEQDIANITDRVEESARDVNETIAEVRKLIDEADVEKVIADIQETTASAREAADGVPATLEEARESLRRLDRIVAARQNDLRVMMENLRLAASNIRMLTDDVKRYPSYGIFGEPPAGQEQD